MPDLLPGGVQVREVGGTVRYRVPFPVTGVRVAGGGIFSVFGGFILATFGRFLYQAGGSWLDHFLRADPAAKLFLAVVSLFLLAVTLLGLCIFLFGIFLVVGHQEITLSRDGIRSAASLGFLGVRSRRRWQQVRRLILIPSSLQADCSPHRPLALIWDGRAEVLTALAGDLARRAELYTPDAKPLRVAEIQAHSEGSRNWQAGRPSLIVSGCSTLFFLPFLAAGILALVSLTHELIRGGPQGMFQGGSPWTYLWLLFPFPFLIAGSAGIYFSWVRWFRPPHSPERRRARPVAEAEEYPGVPTLALEPGSRLPLALSGTAAPGCAAAALLVALLGCSGALTPLVHFRVRPLLGGQPTYDVWLFATAALSVFWCFFAYFLVRQVMLARLPRPTVELASHPLRPGDRGRLHFSLGGPLHLHSLRLALQCVEEVRYREGTDTRTESRTVHETELLRRDSLTISRDTPFEADLDFRIPDGAMHSFESANNEIAWQILVEAAVVRCPDLSDTFPFVVLPPAPGGTRQ